MMAVAPHRIEMSSIIVYPKPMEMSIPPPTKTTRASKDDTKRDSRRSNSEAYRFLSKLGSVDAQYIADTVMSRATLQTASRLKWEKQSVLLTPALMVVK